ncbi:hypothetical protein GCM10023094_09240 [Rhodococcus olei]|uniref:4Fe-4S Wbl-type domain-containing protein n=1 Tax=Rhodococcus olei TaxID=2161675 RepID=A0ABP8NXP6_9NOCA
MTPCTENPDRWLQPGEAHTWLGATWAAHACRTQCDRIVDCARDALAAGTLAGADPNTRPRVADGGIWAGVICRGDIATHQALTAIAYPDEPARAARGLACSGCQREFRRVGDDSGAGSVHRATANSPLCRGCYSKARRQGSQVWLRAAIPERCVDCQRPMTTRSNLRDGFVRHEAKGRCTSCVRASKRGKAA